MGIWQRGTSFTYTAGSVIYTADRFKTQCGGTGGSITVSRETFTNGQTDVPNNPSYYLRTTITTLPTSGQNSDIIQAVEDVRTFAGQTITFSFYAKASTSKSLEAIIGQEFGSGGSGTVYTSITLSSSTIGTTWARYTGTVTMPSITGKTIGTNSHLSCYVRVSNPATGLTWDLANVQLEAGSVATTFQTATGTIQGELAACQRYYYLHVTSAAAGKAVGMGYYQSASQVRVYVGFPVTMRTSPTLVAASGTNYYQVVVNGAADGFNSFTINAAGESGSEIYNGSEVSGTVGQAAVCEASNASSSIAFSSEL